MHDFPRGLRIDNKPYGEGRAKCALRARSSSSRLPQPMSDTEKNFAVNSSPGIPFDDDHHSSKDPFALRAHTAGRLVIDPAEARLEFGDAVAARLKLSADGKTVLWPQPTESPEDPQNWSDGKKSLMLIVVTLAAVVPDFDSGIGIAAIFKLAEEYGTTTGVINNLTSNWSIFLVGWGGITAVMAVRRLGRLPVLFWSQILSLGFLVGATFAPNLNTFTAMRCLTGFFGTTPQVIGLYVVTDLYPFHLQARMLNFWTMGFIISPFLSPFLFGFLVARTSWRWAYGIGCIYGLIVILLIVFLMEETIYDRTMKPIPERPTSVSRYRVETLFGITGLKMQKHRVSWKEAILSPFAVVWRPHILGLLVFEALLFGFGIGINPGAYSTLVLTKQVTNAVFLGSPPPVGFGWSQYAIAGGYGTPIVSVVVGELIGRYMNDWIMDRSVQRNNGVFEAESRLWACYVAVPLNVAGLVLLGAAFQKRLSPFAVIMGWGLVEVSVMINTVAVCQWFLFRASAMSGQLKLRRRVLQRCVSGTSGEHSSGFTRPPQPKSNCPHQGEISALINLARVLGGFGVAYFQIPWAIKSGALQVFGCEAAIDAGLFLLVVPVLQVSGRDLRARFSLR
ncbi:unnamed protein product [Mycena citricolor]|uniref:Major facilitator superfamily (MFS) profile domain-containing protein n=1 Tax=Mycena citricolor TaxID=2018698 RepID=A0AAD2HDF5_9AGAR|nr:unnamed protein product [Mycena citricolor]